LTGIGEKPGGTLGVGEGWEEESWDGVSISMKILSGPSK